MKVLITGADGFIGSHIADLMHSEGHEIECVVHNKKIKNIQHMDGKAEITVCDVADRKKITGVVKKSSPDVVFHMAAQSFVLPSWKDPESTFRTNINGTFYVLEALRNANTNAVAAIACSSAAYGLNYKNEIPIKETKEFRPSSPYAISKATTDHLSFLFWRTYGMKILRLRFFNTIGPRKTGSAIADWAKGIAEIEKGKRKSLGVGNLSSVVDFTDVRDSVRAVEMLTKKGGWGEAYNICSGTGYKMGKILDSINSMSTQKIEVFEDPAKIRPSDDPVFIGDNTKLRKLGWAPKIKIEKTLEDTLNYWRSRV